MQFFLDKEHKNGHSFIVGGGRIIAAIAIIALLITASSCRQVQIVMPPDADTTPETFVAADLDSLVNAVRQAGDGDTIDIRNVSINPEWNQLPLRIRNDVKVTGNIEVSTLASTRSIEEAEASSRALDGKAYLFRVDGNADVVFDSFTVVIEEAAKDFINAVISIDRGSASFSGISITAGVVAVELGTHAAADSVTGTLAGARIEVVPDNPSSFEIAQEIADKTGATPSVGGRSFAVIDTVQNSGYDTLQEAFNKAISGSVIKLGENITPDERFTLKNKTLTLDLNGKSITPGDNLFSSGGIIRIEGGCDITINDSSEDMSGTIDATTNRQDDNGDPAVWLPVFIFPGEGETSSLTINGGRFIGPEYSVSGNGRYGADATTDITINGGYFEATEATAIYQPQSGVLTITGGEIVGNDTAVEIRSGELVITGGKFTARTTSIAVTANGNGTTTEGAAIAIAQHTTDIPVNVTISGGEFNGCASVYQSDPNNMDASDVTIIITGGSFNATNGGDNAVVSLDKEKFISGGIFSTKPEDKYIAEGFASEKTDAGWSVEAYSGRSIYSEDDFERQSIASIDGEVGYDDEAAIILDGDIKLMSDITTEHIIYVPEGTDAILDLNGHVIESKFKGPAVKNLGDLTINDSSASDNEEGTGIIFNSSKIYWFEPHHAIMNLGNVTINGGTFGDNNTDRDDKNSDNIGAALYTSGNATINGGFFTCVDNWGKWENNLSDDPSPATYSYVIRNAGNLTMSNGYVYGRMNGGISSDAGGVTTIDGGEVSVYGTTSYHTLTISAGRAEFNISGGKFSNTGTTSGHIFSIFDGMPSFEVESDREALEAAGYHITGGTFIEDGHEITITE